MAERARRRRGSALAWLTSSKRMKCICGMWAATTSAGHCVPRLGRVPHGDARATAVPADGPPRRRTWGWLRVGSSRPCARRRVARGQACWSHAPCGSPLGGTMGGIGPPRSGARLIETGTCHVQNRKRRVPVRMTGGGRPRSSTSWARACRCRALQRYPARGALVDAVGDAEVVGVSRSGGTGRRVRTSSTVAVVSRVRRRQPVVPRHGAGCEVGGTVLAPSRVGQVQEDAAAELLRTVMGIGPAPQQGGTHPDQGIGTGRTRPSASTGWLTRPTSRTIRVRRVRGAGLDAVGDPPRVGVDLRRVVGDVDDLHGLASCERCGDRCRLRLRCRLRGGCVADDPHQPRRRVVAGSGRVVDADVGVAVRVCRRCSDATRVRSHI